MFFTVASKSLSILTLVLFILSPIPTFAAKKVSDKHALEGLEEIKAVYDVQVKKPKRFAFFLGVIEKTYDGISTQGPAPKFVVAVRGPSIRFITTETWSFSEEDQKYLEEAAQLIARLSERGIRFEACSIAAGLFRIDHETYLDAINPVSNTFISLTGYQAQGYGLVPVN